MKIGISGASGNLGSATVRHLKARLGGQANIVGISRTPEKVEALGVEARRGDFDQPETLAVAFEGLDRLLLIPTDNMQPGVRAKQQSAAIEQAVATGVQHVVLLSAVGARFAEVPHLWESYFVPEQFLMRSAERWTIVRMAYYAESFVQEAQMSLAQGAHVSLAPTPVNFVAREDVAAASAAVLATEGHHGTIYQATGPEALDGPARAALIAKVAGQSYAFAQVTPEQYGEGLTGAGLPPFMVDAVLSIQDMWAKGGFDVTTGDVERLTGRPPKSLADIAKESLRPA